MAAAVLHLTVDKGPKKGETLDRKPGTLIRIGRVVKGNTFTIKDPAISQNHLVIKFVPEISRWTIEDLDTSNGTLINDVMISPSAPLPISDGDVVKIGQDTSISIRIDAAEVKAEKRNAGNRRGKSKKADETSVEETSHVQKRGRSRKVDDLAGVGVKDENLNPIVVEEPKNLGKGRLRRGDSSSILKQDEGLNPVAELQVEESRNLRRGSLKRVDDLVAAALKDENLNPNVIEEPKNLGRRRSRRGHYSRVSNQDEVFDAVAEVPVEESMNLRRGRSRRGDYRNVPEENDISGLVVEDSVDVPMIVRRGRGRGRGRRAPAVKVPKGEEIPSYNYEAEKVAGEEGLDSDSIGGGNGKTAGSEKETDNGGMKEEMVVDIKKMSLGEWFDSMEKFLPMAINDVAEEIISSLQEKARRFDEFIWKDSNVC